VDGTAEEHGNIIIIIYYYIYYIYIYIDIGIGWGRWLFARCLERAGDLSQTVAVLKKLQVASNLVTGK